MSDTTEAILVDHSLNPKNTEPLSLEQTGQARKEIPSCGDVVEVALNQEGGSVRQVQMTLEGCAVSKAAASLFSEAVKGQSPKRINELFQMLEEGLRTGQFSSELGELVNLEGLSRFPARHRCVMLGPSAVKEALES